MKTINIILLLTLFALFQAVISPPANEELFRIEFMNCKRIQVGEKWLRRNDTFEDPKTIHWTNAKQYMRVRSLKTQKEFGLSMEVFAEAKVQNLRDYLMKTNSASTRGVARKLHYSQVRHYLVDSLHFQAFDAPQPDVVTEAVWQRPDGSEQVTTLERTEDNAFYVVKRDILGRGTPPDSLRLDIQERSTKENWTNRIYRQIPIRCLPQKVK